MGDPPLWFLGEHKSMGVAVATACAMANDTPASWSGWGRQQAFAGGHDGNRAGGKGPGGSSAGILLLAPCAWLGAIGGESLSPAAFWLLQALSHVWLCRENAGERWPSLPFIPSKVELVPSSQLPASLTKPGCCLQSAWARLACSHSSSPPGRVAEAAGRRRFVIMKTQGCVCQRAPAPCRRGRALPNVLAVWWAAARRALGELGRDGRAVVLFETGTVCAAFCEVLDEQAGLSWCVYPLNKPSPVGVREATEKRRCLKTTGHYCGVRHPSTHQGETTWSPLTSYVVPTAYSSASPPLPRDPRRDSRTPFAAQHRSSSRFHLCRRLKPGMFGICSPCPQPRDGAGVRGAGGGAEHPPAPLGLGGQRRAQRGRRG